MLARRGRLNMKPNMAKGAKAPLKSAPLSSYAELPETSNKAEENNSVDVSNTASKIEVMELDTPGPSVADATFLREDAPVLTDTMGSSISINAPSTELTSNRTDVGSPPRTIKLSADGHHRPVSPRRPTMTDSPEKLKKPRRKFIGDEKLDTKKMRMMDMIFWNPKAEKGMTRKNTEDVASIVDPVEKPMPQQAKVAAPQVKIGDDGNLVLDESSLFIEETRNDTSAWDIVDDDRITRKVTSLSFRNRLWRKGTTWTDKETELFFEILRCTGPDFGLMHEFFPSRARNELKCKFNREERLNWNRVNDVLSKPSMLDESLYERAAKMESEIEEEATRKKEEADAKKKKKTDSDVPKRQKATIDWDESTANLEKEAKEIILELEKQDLREKAQGGNQSESSSSDSDSDASVKQSSRSRKKPLSKAARNILKLAEASIKKDKDTASTKDKKPNRLSGYGAPPSTSLSGYTSKEKDPVDSIPKSTRPEPNIRPVGRLRGRGRGMMGNLGLQRKKINETKDNTSIEPIRTTANLMTDDTDSAPEVVPGKINSVCASVDEDRTPAQQIDGTRKDDSHVSDKVAADEAHMNAETKNIRVVDNENNVDAVKCSVNEAKPIIDTSDAQNLVESIKSSAEVGSAEQVEIVQATSIEASVVEDADNKYPVIIKSAGRRLSRAKAAPNVPVPVSKSVGNSTDAESTHTAGSSQSTTEKVEEKRSLRTRVAKKTPAIKSESEAEPSTSKPVRRHKGISNDNEELSSGEEEIHVIEPNSVLKALMERVKSQKQDNSTNEDETNDTAEGSSTSVQRKESSVDRPVVKKKPASRGRGRGRR